MLEYDRTDESEGIDVNKTNASKECDNFHYWQNATRFKNVAIVSIKENECRICF